MKKIFWSNKEYFIDCDDEMCGNCKNKPDFMSDQKCKLFCIVMDHLSSGVPDSGWKRLSECKNAEVQG